ncbi:hypothetical protein DN412_10050 [Cupriavidus lacunae]|uniref:Uncharacterized protein n=1 Tax=Cupriavidus lacunae TaxID=2666307 RepID=A0A370NY86_9BURK|nr:hypothetical protein DN412_10050 [Cupriavidus lacunae]
MKTILFALLGLGALAASFPAAAGPDWAVIERGRAAARADARTAQARNATPCAQTAVAASAASPATSR